ncbi:protein kinase [Rhodococcus sp. ARC_M6]|uniref:protein kinase domain-containing protein n=1 Tax=Rhodococcus sp. ARC_M6 TaxID=2928852 RepID=UPI001FB4B38E|nr:protein kinase [Rhodococcus sp. ARC_M6]MCJ0904246.1 protein kinase [Rhodococcus sp. ARC_M6]
MVDNDPPPTQRDVVIADLTAAGFEDAEEIGRGGFGVVFRCLERSLDRTVAVKVLTGTFNRGNVDRFLREQRAMGRLTGHPNIVNALQIGETSSGRPYIVMPYHPLDSLQARISRDGRLDCEAVLRLGVKVAGALETAHRLGIIHRDVKPANILLTDYGEPELTDFGIAYVAADVDTAAGSVAGSPAFTAPEVVDGEAPGAAADIYGLAATLFSAATGRPVPDVREQGIPDDVREVLERAMSVRPDDRPATAAEFGDELRQIQGDHSWPVDEMALNTEPLPARTTHDRPRASDSTPRSFTPRSFTPRSFTPRNTPSSTNSVGSKTSRDHLGNLPLELTSFVGRRREMTETKKLLASSRLVTLTGVGGVGKTRLALHVARHSRQAFSDGVWLVELGEVRDEPLVAEEVAATLGLRNLSARPAVDTLIQHLSTCRILLVLDNCEQLLDPVAELTESILRTCPEVRILATSREPLGIGGETVVRVPPLTVPAPDQIPSLRGLSGYDAVTLFTERACAAVPTFEITEDNRVPLAQICHRLDGLPLPIELAAARLRSMSMTQILEHLTDRFQLLTGGSRGAPSRQQTLRLCMDWSYELCSPLEQQLWARLSVFAGGFELDAVESLCAFDFGPGDVLDGLASLVDKSILIREEPTSVVRYRLLETLREYGWEKLHEAGESTAIRRRHRDWFEKLALRGAAEWISSTQLEWITRLGHEQPNLHEALEFCLSESNSNDVEPGLHLAGAMFPFWFSRGVYSEARHWFDRVLACKPSHGSIDRLSVIYGACLLLAIQGDNPVGVTLAEEGRVIADELASPVADALVAHADGVLALFSGDMKGAITSMESARAAFRSDGNLLRRVLVLNQLGMAYDSIGDPTRAIACYEESLAITGPVGESLYRGRTSTNLGLALWKQWQQGKETDPARAEALMKQGLRLARRVDDPLGSAWCLELLAWIAGGDDTYRHAALLMGAAQAQWHEIGNPAIRLLSLTGDHDKCEQNARQALGQRTFEAEFKKGKGMTFADAAALALGENPQVTNPPSSGGTNLTKREHEVAELVAGGLTNKAIAAKLVISQRTAQGHVEHILTKLGFNSRTQIAGWVVERAHEVT